MPAEEVGQDGIRAAITVQGSGARQKRRILLARSAGDGPGAEPESWPCGQATRPPASEPA